jgi:hypothetical protein
VIRTVSATETVSFLSFRSDAISCTIARTALGGNSDAAIDIYFEILISCGEWIVHITLVMKVRLQAVAPAV